jgi:hypothetical protein
LLLSNLDITPHPAGMRRVPKMEMIDHPLTAVFLGPIRELPEMTSLCLCLCLNSLFISSYISYSGRRKAYTYNNTHSLHCVALQSIPFRHSAPKKNPQEINKPPPSRTQHHSIPSPKHRSEAHTSQTLMGVK